MPETRGRKASLVLAGVVALLSIAIAIGLLIAAGRDGAWLARTWGGLAVVLGLSVAGLIGIRSRPGETHYWSMVAMLTVAAMLLGGYSYRPGGTKLGSRAETIPMITAGGWVGVSQEVDEKTMQILGTTDIIMRYYRRGADGVGLAVIFAEGSRKVAHPPEQCYAAEGREFSEIVPDSVTMEDGRVIHGTRLIFVSTQSGQGQVVWYTYKADDLYTSNFLLQQAYVIWCNLMMRTSTRVALIRLTSGIESLAEAPQALEKIKDFARVVFPEVEKAIDGIDDESVAATP